MSNIAGKLDCILNIKNSIKSALIVKGRNPSNVFSTYSDEILAIPINVEDAIIDRTVTSCINDRVANIGAYAFYECSSLKTADFPNVNTIGNYGFAGCASLEMVNIPKVTSMGMYAFGVCSSLKTADFPNVTKIDSYAFQNCSSLEGVNLPNVTSIKKYTFSGCGALKTIDFSNLTEIDRYSFTGCSSLTTFIMRNTETACVLMYPDTLYDTPIRSGTGYVYVPRVLIDYYASTSSNWRTYASQLRALEDYTVDGTTTGALDLSKI